MATNKHYIKVFITDGQDDYVVNYNGEILDIKTSADSLASGMGYDIKGEMDKILEADDDAIYVFRIDYTVTPIRNDPFK